MDFDIAGLINLRQSMGFTQAQMADAMGMPYRTYQAIENGQNPLRPIHVKAAKFAAIEAAASGAGYVQLPWDLGELVFRASRGRN